MVSPERHFHAGGNGSRIRGLAPGPFSPRIAAWRALNALDRDHPDAADLLDREMRRPDASDADRRLATHLTMGVLRHRAKLDHCLAQLLDKPMEEQHEPLLNILRIGAYQALFFDRVPEYAIVNETVEAVRRAGMERAGGLVNGVLRNLMRRVEEMKRPVQTGDPARDFEIEYSCPAWTRAMLDESPLKNPWRQWWIRAQEPPPLHLRVNTLKTTREALIEELKALGHEPQQTPAPDCLAVPGIQRPADLACFQEGRAAIQDVAAAMVGHLVAPRPGERVVDFCSAPGGKTAHIAALSENRANILATDSSTARLNEVPKTVQRLGVTRVRVEAIKGPLLAQYTAWADAVLVDAPCTGMGTIRRHPEIRWLRNREDVIDASLKQRVIMDIASQMVRRGGRLVYSTCTLFREENWTAIEAFLEKHADFDLVDPRPSAPPFLQPYLAGDGTLSTVLDASFPLDGFFAAVMAKNR